MGAYPLVVVAQNEAQHNLEGHAAHVARNIHTFVSPGRQLPFPQEFRIDGRDHFDQGLDGLMIERRLNHPPLPLPEIPLANHEAISKK